jgi:hypothetical protein
MDWLAVKTRCGIFDTGWGNPASLAQQRAESAETGLICDPFAAGRWRPSCPSTRTEHHVFRTLVLSIVLTVAVGQNAALLCSAWCRPQVAECHHDKPAATSSVISYNTCDECDKEAVGAALFLREDVRRTVCDPDVDHAILVPRSQIAQVTIDTRLRREPSPQWSLERRSLATVLRL